MQSYLLLTTPTSIEACGGGGAGSGSGFSSLFNFKGPTLFVGSSRLSDQRWNSGLPTKQQHPSGGGGGGLVVSAAINSKQDHYGLLGLSSTASPSEIKRAYRLLARKYHPDVSKHVQAGDIFKSIRLAYDPSCCKLNRYCPMRRRRTQYDHELKIREYYGRPRRRNWTHDPELEEGTRMYRWEEMRRQMRREKYRRQYQAAEQGSSSYVDTEDEDEEESSSEERGSFSEVLRFTFLLLSLVQIFGSQVSLLVCSSIALVDRKLDAGYKMGYVIAWILGGRGGILLSLCLSFASWLCGKTSSSLATLVVVAMWFSTSIARYAPVPLGALITLLYMSVKLQNDLS